MLQCILHFDYYVLHQARGPSLTLQFKFSYNIYLVKFVILLQRFFNKTSSDGPANQQQPAEEPPGEHETDRRKQDRQNDRRGY